MYLGASGTSPRLLTITGRLYGGCMKDELRELYPELHEDELEEAERNVEEYAKALADMYLRIRREKMLKRQQAEEMVRENDSC